MDYKEETYRGFRLMTNPESKTFWDNVEYCRVDEDGTYQFGFAQSFESARVDIDFRYYGGQRPLLKTWEVWSLIAVTCILVWAFIFKVLFPGYWS